MHCARTGENDPHRTLNRPTRHHKQPSSDDQVVTERLFVYFFTQFDCLATVPNHIQEQLTGRALIDAWSSARSAELSDPVYREIKAQYLRNLEQYFQEFISQSENENLTKSGPKQYLEIRRALIDFAVGNERPDDVPGELARGAQMSTRLHNEFGISKYDLGSRLHIEILSRDEAFTPTEQKSVRSFLSGFEPEYNHRYRLIRTLSSEQQPAAFFESAERSLEVLKRLYVRSMNRLTITDGSSLARPGSQSLASAVRDAESAVFGPLYGQPQTKIDAVTREFDRLYVPLKRQYLGDNYTDLTHEYGSDFDRNSTWYKSLDNIVQQTFPGVSVADWEHEAENEFWDECDADFGSDFCRRLPTASDLNALRNLAQ